MASYLDKDGLSYYNGKINTKLSSKQDTLVSGTNIKTINSNSLLGSGDIDVTNTAILTYGTSTWNEFTTAYNSGKMVFCLVRQSSGYRYATLNYAEPGSRGKAEFLYLRKTNHGSSQQTDQMFTYTLSPNGEWTTTQTNIGSNVTVGTDAGLTKSYSSGTLTLEVNKVTSVSSSSTDAEIPTAKCLYDNLDTKQDTLVSGTNIKTINNTSILGSGDITISGGGGGVKTYHFIQGSGTTWGGSSARAVDFDMMEAGCRYVYYNKDATYGFYYKYTKKDGTVVDTFINLTGADNRAITSAGYNYYRRIEVEVYNTVEDTVNAEDEYVPCLKVTFYPTSPCKAKTTDDQLYSAGIEYLVYSTGQPYGYLQFRQTLGFTDSQWLGKVINDLAARVSALEN